MKILAWFVFFAALAWAVILAVAAGAIYLRQDVPWHSLNEWAISIQTEGIVGAPNAVSHTSSNSLFKFYGFTCVLLLLGAWSYRYLRLPKQGERHPTMGV
jgi:hypothetical protein